jgi:hypothetical protein
MPNHLSTDAVSTHAATMSAAVPVYEAATTRALVAHIHPLSRRRRRVSRFPSARIPSLRASVQHYPATLRVPTQQPFSHNCRMRAEASLNWPPATMQQRNSGHCSVVAGWRASCRCFLSGFMILPTPLLYPFEFRWRELTSHVCLIAAHTITDMFCFFRVGRRLSARYPTPSH